MQTRLFSQFLSLGLAALMTVGVLAGIDHLAKAQTPIADPVLAQVAATRA